MQDSRRVLVIEDDPDISELIEFNLERHGFHVITAGDGEVGLQKATTQIPDIVLLDIMLPGIDGLSVLRKVRECQATKNVPVIMISAKGEESDIVIGLELGADDYMTKPFSPNELIARVKAVSRRSSGKSEAKNLIEVGPLKIDCERHEIRVRNQDITFTLAEFNILKLLATRPGRVFTRDQILETVAGRDTYLVDRNVDVHIRSIRKKLDQDKDFILTIRGVGYKCKE